MLLHDSFRGSWTNGHPERKLQVSELLSILGEAEKFIGWMLKEDPKVRSNIYQVVKETCAMRGTQVPIKDIYAERTRSEARRKQTLPPDEGSRSSPGPIGLQKAKVEAQCIPDIAPMRRVYLPLSHNKRPIRHSQAHHQPGEILSPHLTPRTTKSALVRCMSYRRGFLS